MKSVVFEQKLSRNYYLGTHFIRYFCGFEPIKLSVESLEDELGKVMYEDKHLFWEELFETEDYTREFSVGEYLSIDGENYEIVNVAHAEDGTVFYRINKRVIVENEESKLNTETDLAARKLLLGQRKEQKDKVDKETKEEEKIVAEDKPKKRWYQFWK